MPLALRSPRARTMSRHTMCMGSVISCCSVQPAAAVARWPQLRLLKRLVVWHTRPRAPRDAAAYDDVDYIGHTSLFPRAENINAAAAT